MLRSLIFGLSAAAVAAGLSVTGLVHQPPAAGRLDLPGPAFGYAAHGAAERADLPPPAAAPQPSSIQDIIRGAFEPLGPSLVDWAERIAWCESKYDPVAVNPESDARGLFQFLPTTWAGTPYAAASPFDPVANARAAAWLLQRYGASQWACQA